MRASVALLDSFLGFLMVLISTLKLSSEALLTLFRDHDTNVEAACLFHFAQLLLQLRPMSRKSTNLA